MVNPYKKHIKPSRPWRRHISPSEPYKKHIQPSEPYKKHITEPAKTPTTSTPTKTVEPQKFVSGGGGSVGSAPASPTSATTPTAEPQTELTESQISAIKREGMIQKKQELIEEARKEQLEWKTFKDKLPEELKSTKEQIMAVDTSATYYKTDEEGKIIKGTGISGTEYRGQLLGYHASLVDTQFKGKDYEKSLVGYKRGLMAERENLKSRSPSHVTMSGQDIVRGMRMEKEQADIVGIKLPFTKTGFVSTWTGDTPIVTAGVGLGQQTGVLPEKFLGLESGTVSETIQAGKQKFIGEALGAKDYTSFKYRKLATSPAVAYSAMALGGGYAFGKASKVVSPTITKGLGYAGAGFIGASAGSDIYRGRWDIGTSKLFWAGFAYPFASVGYGVGTGKVSDYQPFRAEVVKIRTEKGLQTAWKGIYGEKGGRVTWELGLKSKTGKLAIDKPFTPSQSPMETKIILKKLPEVYPDYLVTRAGAGIGIMRLTHDQPSAFIQKKFSREAKFLSEKGVGTTIKWAKGQKGTLYGSFGARSQLPKGSRIPADIDVQLPLGREASIKATQKLYGSLLKAGEPVRISAKSPTLIESKVGGRWHHAVDIHSVEPTYPTGFGAGSEEVLEGAWGFTYGQKPIRIEGLKTMPLSEQGLRKGASVLTLRKTDISPEAHRVKDIGDFFSTQEVLLKSMGTKNILKQGKGFKLLETFKGTYSPSEMTTRFHEPVNIPIYQPTTTPISTYGSVGVSGAISRSARISVSSPSIRSGYSPSVSSSISPLFRLPKSPSYAKSKPSKRITSPSMKLFTSRSPPYRSKAPRSPSLSISKPVKSPYAPPYKAPKITTTFVPSIARARKRTRKKPLITDFSFGRQPSLKKSRGISFKPLKIKTKYTPTLLGLMGKRRISKKSPLLKAKFGGLAIRPPVKKKKKSRRKKFVFSGFSF